MTPTRIGPLVFGADAVIAEFVRQRIPNSHGFGECTAIGIIRHEKLVAGVVFFDYSPQYKSIQFAGASDSAMWASKSVLRSLFSYPFVQLGCVRMTSMVAKKNKRSRKFTEGIGLKLEGVARKGFLTDDACIYGILRHECRWLEENNGQKFATRSAAAA